MPDLINWYLTELRLRLQKDLAPDRLDNVLREAESHLRESAKRIYEANQISEEAAIQAALQAYGTPERVASTYLSRSGRKLFGLNPMWSVLVGGALAIASWDFNWISFHGFFDNFGETWENGLACFIGVLALVVMAVGCARGQRRFRLPLLSLGLGSAVFAIPLLSFWIVGATDYHQGFSRIHLSRDVAMAKQSLSKLEAYKGYYMRGSAAFAAANSVADLPAEFTSGFLAAKELGIPSNELLMDPDPRDRVTDASLVVPYSGVFAEIDGRMTGVATASDFASAKKAWLERSAHDIDSANRQEQEFKGLLASADEAQSGRVFFFNKDVYGETVQWTLIFTPGLLLIEWCVYAGTRRRRYWPGRALA